MNRLIKKFILLFLFSLLVLPQVVLAADEQIDEPVVTITLQDIYQEMKEMRVETMNEFKEIRKEMVELRKEMATKEEIQEVRSSIDKVWQMMIGFIATLVIALITIKYFVFQVDIKKVKELIQEAINKAKPIL